MSARHGQRVYEGLDKWTGRQNGISWDIYGGFPSPPSNLIAGPVDKGSIFLRHLDQSRGCGNYIEVTTT